MWRFFLHEIPSCELGKFLCTSIRREILTTLFGFFIGDRGPVLARKGDATIGETIRIEDGGNRRCEYNSFDSGLFLGCTQDSLRALDRWYQYRLLVFFPVLNKRLEETA